jgi:hypothetical protein
LDPEVDCGSLGLEFTAPIVFGGGGEARLDLHIVIDFEGDQLRGVAAALPLPGGLGFPMGAACAGFRGGGGAHGLVGGVGLNSYLHFRENMSKSRNFWVRVGLNKSEMESQEG